MCFPHRIAIRHVQPGENLLSGRKILERRLKTLNGFIPIDLGGKACARIDFKGSQIFRKDRRIDPQRLRVGDANGQHDQIAQLGRRRIDLGLNGRRLDVSEIV